MTFLRDVRFGWRLLARNRSYAASALVVVALGIGATTAVFSVLRGILLTPLAYREPNRIVLFRADLPGVAHQPALTSDEFFALRDRVDLFDSVAAIVQADGSLTSPDDMAALNAVSISDTFFETLGVRLLLGRSVSRADAGTASSVNISYELWQQHFHGDPSILGRRIEVNNNPMTVVGVLPRGFRAYLGSGVTIPPEIDIWYGRSRGYDDDPFRGQVIVARLRRGIPIETARAAVDTIAGNLVAAHPASYRTGAVRLSVSPLDREVVSDVKPALAAIAGAVGFVLIVACANLTNLLLTRASARTRELALRISIGASRGQIVRQLVAEGLVLGALGAGGGVLLAQWGVDVLLSLAPLALPRREAIAVDGGVALFAVALSLVSTLVVSLIPAWQVTKSDVAGSLKDNRQVTRGASMTRGLLVASQLALSLVLLVGAGLMGRAFVSIRAVPLGYEPHGAATMYISLQGRRFGGGTIEEARATRLAFYHDVLQSVRTISGVEHAGVGFPVPLSNTLMAQRFATGPDAPQRPAEGVIALAGYLDTLRVPLVAGRYFSSADDNQPVIVVDQRLAEDLWPRQSAIGRRLMLIPTVGQPQWVEIVGVVAHAQTQSLRTSGLPQIWMTYASRSYAQLNIVVRASDPIGALASVAQTVQRLGAGRPVRDIRKLDDDVANASADTRFALFVLGVFAVLAVVLTAIGVYGVVAYATARRAREIAVRLALGADALHIVALVVRDGLMWTVLGLAAGVAGAFALSRYLSALLFQIGDRDPLTFAGVAALLCTIALVATAVPALKAVHVDPMLALRSE